MEIISEPAFTEEKQVRYDIGFTGDIFSFVKRESMADTVTESRGVLTAELYSPRETIRIVLANTLWIRMTPQTIQRPIVKAPPSPVTPTPSTT